MPKLSKKLPSRVTNEKAKAKRSRSWNKTQQAKIARIMIQEQRQRENVRRGYTGKQLDDATRKYAKLHHLPYRQIIVGSELTVAAEMGLI